MPTPTKRRSTRSITDMEVWMEVRDYRKLATLKVVQEKTYKQIADGAGFKSTAYVHQLFTGAKKTLTTDRAIALARYFGVGVDDLFLGRVSTGSGQNANAPRTKVAA